MARPSEPILHLIVGPNGAGKSSYYARHLSKQPGLPFINADLIAAARWPDDTERMSYEAARIAEEQREQALIDRTSFVAETVSSHPSKVELIERAASLGYHVILHVLLIPEDLAVLRVESRVAHGGHPVPEEKIRSRYQRLWSLVRRSIGIAAVALVRDNSRLATPFRLVAKFERGHPVMKPDWPPWTPPELKSLG